MKRTRSVEGDDVLALPDGLGDFLLVPPVDLVGNAEVLELLGVSICHHQRTLGTILSDYSDFLGLDGVRSLLPEV
jgi:hypothetical protein